MSRVTTDAPTTNRVAPSGVPCRRDTRASGAGIRRSRAIAKIPREADTAQPIATASMSNRTTSSSSRSIQTPP